MWLDMLVHTNSSSDNEQILVKLYLILTKYIFYIFKHYEDIGDPI